MYYRAYQVDAGSGGLRSLVFWQPGEALDTDAWLGGEQKNKTLPF
jgi:hypothetical protein